MALTLDQMARELCADLSDDLDTNVSQKAAKAVLSRVFEYIGGTLEENHDVNIPGFGKFRIVDKPEREARNPRTGETMTVAAKRTLKFSPAKQLKERVI